MILPNRIMDSPHTPSSSPDGPHTCKCSQTIQSSPPTLKHLYSTSSNVPDIGKYPMARGQPFDSGSGAEDDGYYVISPTQIRSDYTDTFSGTSFDASIESPSLQQAGMNRTHECASSTMPDHQFDSIQEERNQVTRKASTQLAEHSKESSTSKEIPSLRKAPRHGRMDLVEVPPEPLPDSFEMEEESDEIRARSGPDVENLDYLQRKKSFASVVKELGIIKKKSIQWKSLTWQKTAAILFGEYIAMAIMTLPWAYSVLGLIPGIIASICVSASVCYTSLTLWKYCLRHPECVDICSVGHSILGGGVWAWWFTTIIFVLNNTFIQGLHVALGGMFFNTISNHAICTVYFYLITAIICFFLSLPRPFSALSTLASISSITTFIMIVLSIIFSGVLYSRSHTNQPAVTGSSIGINLWPREGVTYIHGSMAFLNIAYAFIGQLALPTLIAEMKYPMQFPRVIYAVSIAELIVALLAGGLILYFKASMVVSKGTLIVLNAPEFTDNPIFKNICICFGVPTIIFIGIMFSTLSCKFLFFIIFPSTSHHRTTTTLKSRLTWAALHASTWTAAFLIASLIPIFSDLLGFMCALFDSFLGLIFWGLAWIRMRKEDLESRLDHERKLLHGVVAVQGLDVGRRRWWNVNGVGGMVEVVVNLGLLLAGGWFLIGGGYAAVVSIREDMKNLAGRRGGFSCENISF